MWSSNDEAADRNFDLLPVLMLDLVQAMQSSNSISEITAVTLDLALREVLLRRRIETMTAKLWRELKLVLQ